MKKILLIITIFFALIGCNESKNQNPDTVINIEDTQVPEIKEMDIKDHSVNNAWVNEIKLDNGKKWQANLETNEGVDKMLKLVKSSDPKTIKEYHELASKLNGHKNFLVKKCTMEGPSHDNLHIFLHPLIEKIEILQNVSTTNEGLKAKASIKENLEGYYNYFQ